MSADLVGLALLAALALAAAAAFVLAPLRGGPGARLSAAIAAASLVAAGGIYLAVGRPDALRDAASVATDPAEQFARQVTERLAQLPEDAAGWRMLGGIRTMQGRYAEASTAFARARGLSGDSDPGALIGYAEAQVLEDPSRLVAMAPLFARTLELKPDDQKALWYGGHAAMEAGDQARARALWTRLLQQDVPEPLREAVRARLGSDAPPASPSGADPGGASVLLEANIALAPELAARVAPDTPLFVFVRAPGVAAPVLVKRVAQPTFPLRVAFTAADRLGQAVEIGAGFAVGARLSRSGTAARGSGDIEGSATVGAGGSVAVKLDREVP